MAGVRIGANEVAASKMIQFFVWLVVVGVVIYSEVLYLGIVSFLFPPGVLFGACILGAFATGISVLCLYAGKSHWFRPGSQLMTAWFFTGLEVLILILNDVLAMAIHQGGQLDQYLSLYRFFVPAVPVIALIGWGILLFLDPARKVRHAHMEMEDRQQEQMLEFEQAQFEAQMEVRYKALGYMKEQLMQAVATDASIEHIRQGAYLATSNAISQLTGIQQLTMPPVTVNATSEQLQKKIDGLSQNTEPLQPVVEKPSKSK